MMYNNITTLIGNVVALMPEYYNAPVGYLYGHRQEINNILIEKDKQPGAVKYPLVALRLDVEETHESGTIYFKGLNIAILSNTSKDYYASQRMELVFEPILYPLYDAFFKALAASNEFFYDGGDFDRPPHTKIDRCYYGVTAAEANLESIFSDDLDAIEILDLNLNRIIKNC
jgi:hypothetical protein